jgi:hypothetical protein
LQGAGANNTHFDYQAYLHSIVCREQGGGGDDGETQHPRKEMTSHNHLDSNAASGQPWKCKKKNTHFCKEIPTEKRQQQILVELLA